jgi:hypothetical protein
MLSLAASTKYSKWPLNILAKCVFEWNRQKTLYSSEMKVFEPNVLKSNKKQYMKAYLYTKATSALPVAFIN